MDDPWGSPWANSDDKTSKGLDLPAPPPSLLAPPRRALVGGSSALSSSPWADENAFGSRVGGEQSDGLSSGWNSLGDTAPPPPVRTSRAGSTATGKTSPAGWPSPGLLASPRNRMISVGHRQPSPDLWSVDSPWNDSSRRPSLLHASSSFTLQGKVEPKEEGILTELKSPDVGPKDSISTVRPEQTLPGEKENGSNDQELSGGYQDRMDGNVRIQGQPESIKSIPSRPPSTFSEDSDHDPDRPDSPITSIGEEPTNRFSKTSAIYDSLDRVVPDSRASSEFESGGTGLDSVVSDDMKHKSKAELDNVQDIKSVSSSSESPKTPPVGISINDHLNEEENVKLRDNTSSPLVQEIEEEHGPISFQLNFEPIDQLFDDEPPSLLGPVEPGDLPDRPITDSFGTVEERKAWYRISRYGSARKQNFGDDENYKQVTWSKSEIHADTIKIVKRWMEEDSFTGKPSLGGKRTSMFNWDSPTSPVDLRQVFARRKLSVSHARAASQLSAPSIHKATPSTASANSAFEQRQVSRASVGSPTTTAVTTAVFGWSSSSAQSLPGASPIPPPSSKAPSLASPHTAAPRMSSTNTADLDDDNDKEWGEMIVSPTMAAMPTTLQDDFFSSASSQKQSPVLSSPSHVISVQHDRHSSLAQLAQTRSTSQQPAGYKQDNHTLGSPESASVISGMTPKDPWACADLSIFETSGTGSIPSPIKLGAALPFSPVLTPTQKPSEVSAGPVPHPTHTMPTPAAISPVNVQNTHDHEEQERAIRAIIHNLPDLTYMSR